MSGTSLDGIDGVLASFPDAANQAIETLATSYIPFPDDLRQTLLSLQQPGANEIHQEAIAANLLADLYSDAVTQLLASTKLATNAIRAIGVHGQTIRHRPELGFSRQTNNPARLAEKTNIDVIADFRSRDIAAGGQGAPLVPAFHHAVFGSPTESRAVINIGGFSNISALPAETNKPVFGFDTGPGNILMDGWIARHQHASYDANGAWAASGTVHPELLTRLLADPFFSQPPPKSTGRDNFHLQWLDQIFAGLPAIAPADVQATLCALTATTIAHAIHAYAPDTTTAYICGGGAYNTCLMGMLTTALHAQQQATTVTTTSSLGVAPNHVEALAFAWLAERFTARAPANLPAVTGAQGPRLLGALYPA
jgi:anhydro-N-acetylmuramic acid kinase